MAEETRLKSLFCKLCGIKTKEDGNVHMKQLCYSPTPICPSTDSILQLDIILPHRQGEEEEEEEKREAEVGRQTKQTEKEEEEPRGGGQHTFSSRKAEEEKVKAARTWPLVR